MNSLKDEQYYIENMGNILLTEKDRFITKEATKEDLITLVLLEPSSSGYHWNISGIKQASFDLVMDFNIEVEEQSVGSVTKRVLTMSPPKVEGIHKLLLILHREWESKPPLDTFYSYVRVF